MAGHAMSHGKRARGGFTGNVNHDAGIGMAQHKGSS